MTVFLIGKFDNESFAWHIRQTLEEHGHTVISFHYGVKYRHQGFMHHKINSAELLLERLFWNTTFSEERMFKRLKKALKEVKVDLTICCHDFLRPSEVSYIKQTTSAPVFLWFPDAIVNFGKHMFLNAAYDGLFFKDRFVVERLQNEFPSKKFYYLPECCNPVIHKLYEPGPADHNKFSCDIATAGNLYANRVLFFDQLSSSGLDIRIWGNPASKWMDTNNIQEYIKSEYLMQREKGVAFRLAKIVTNNLHPAEINSVNCRAFEIPALGGFQLISWRDCIPELFEPGKEIEVYRSYDELKDKISFYLKNEEHRKPIIRNGFERAHKEHTYANRLSQLLSVAHLKL